VTNSESRDFADYARRVYAWAYRVLGRHHDALDVVQDVYMKWNRQCARERPGRIGQWLRTVTLNRAIDVHRRRKFGAAPLDGEAPERPAPRGQSHTGPSAPGDSVSKELEREDLRNQVNEVLHSLTPLQRSVLVGKVYDELTFAEIAAEMDLAVSTVKTHYLRAVKALRDRLTPDWGGPR
jgi:RNA polymerase sigma-70 factor (ECF subfamily)